jgi:hypothetical protein
VPAMWSGSTRITGASPKTSSAWPTTSARAATVCGSAPFRPFDLERQIGGDGATWLDRETRMPPLKTGVGRHVAWALDLRAERRIETGLRLPSSVRKSSVSGGKWRRRAA